MGTLSFSKDNKSFKIILSDDPAPGVGFDITTDNNDSVFPVKKTLPYSSVGYIKPKLAHLFSFNNGHFSKTKGHLLQADMIYIINSKDAYTQIGFKSFKTWKISEYWINTADIENPNADLWKNF